MERQELWCHWCSNYVRFMLDPSINGNYVLSCPECDHEHCRVVNNGRITDMRWDQRNGPLNGLPVTYISSASTSSSAVSYYDTYTASSSSSNISYDTWLYSGTSAST